MDTEKHSCPKWALEDKRESFLETAEKLARESGRDSAISDSALADLRTLSPLTILSGITRKPSSGKAVAPPKDGPAWTEVCFRLSLGWRVATAPGGAGTLVLEAFELGRGFPFRAASRTVHDKGRL